MLAEAIVLDPDNRAFMEQANPDALKEASERLLEAQQRGMWTDPGQYKEKLIDTIVDIDASLESKG